MMPEKEAQMLARVSQAGGSEEELGVGGAGAGVGHGIELTTEELLMKLIHFKNRKTGSMKGARQMAATRTRKRGRNDGQTNMILPGAHLRGASLDFS